MAVPISAMPSSISTSSSSSLIVSTSRSRLTPSLRPAPDFFVAWSVSGRALVTALSTRVWRAEERVLRATADDLVVSMDVWREEMTESQRDDQVERIWRRAGRD